MPQRGGSVTSLSRALLNPLTEEATEPLWLEIFYHLLSGALSLVLSTAEKKGKVCLQSDLGVCEGVLPLVLVFQDERSYCLFSLVTNCHCMVRQLHLLLFSYFLHYCLFRTGAMVLSCIWPSMLGILVHKTAPSAISTWTTVRRCRKSCRSQRGNKILSWIY